MLRRVVEDYLESIREVQFFLPFASLLMLKGYFDVHIVHGPTEFGKDIIAKKTEGEVTSQIIFQLKAGDVNLSKFTAEVKPQLLEAVTNPLAHPNFDNTLNKQIFLVTTGILKQPATLAFQEFNVYLQTKLNSGPIYTIEKHDIVEDFVRSGLESFFTLHNDPAFVGDFFDMYAKIKNNKEITSFDVEAYTKRWLDLDYNNNVNRLQVLFESYLFSSSQYKEKKYYQSTLFIAGLARYLAKYGKYDVYEKWIIEYLKLMTDCIFDDVSSLYKADQTLADPASSAGMLGIFKYPKICLHALELLSLYMLVSDTAEKAVKDLTTTIIGKERGWERPLSDNYAASIALIGLSLIKNDEVQVAKKLLNNVTIWFCDRYSNIGVAPLGSSEEEEFQFLLSEYLEGFDCKKRRSSFLAAVLLDMAHILGDANFYSEVANELRATSIILERFHVLNESELFTYDRVNNSYDSTYSKDYVEEYSDGIAIELESNKVSVRSKSLFYIIFLLRDRIFPTFIKEIM